MAVSFSKKQRDMSKKTGKVLVAFGYDGRGSNESNMGACDLSFAASDAEAKEIFNAVMDIHKKYKKPRPDPTTSALRLTR